jgi:hypothetical protein
MEAGFRKDRGTSFPIRIHGETFAFAATKTSAHVRANCADKMTKFKGAPRRTCGRHLVAMVSINAPVEMTESSPSDCATHRPIWGTPLRLHTLAPTTLGGLTPFLRSFAGMPRIDGGVLVPSEGSWHDGSIEERAAPPSRWIAVVAGLWSSQRPRPTPYRDRSRRTDGAPVRQERLLLVRRSARTLNRQRWGSVAATRSPDRTASRRT